MEQKRPLQSIPDDELLHRLAELMGQSRRIEANIVAHIAEVEERRLYAREAFPSMFAYCTGVLHLSEAEAYLRIAAARASLRHPMLLTMLADGRLHLTAINLLAPQLTLENGDGLLKRATHRSKRQIQELIAEFAPRPDVRSLVRKLPERKTQPSTARLAASNRAECSTIEMGLDPTLELRPDRVATPGARAGRDEAVGNGEASQADASSVVFPPAVATPALNVRVSAPLTSPALVQPLSPGRYKVQFTAGAEFREKLERLRALIGSRGPDGDLAAVIEQAVTEKLERLEARRFAQTKAARKHPAEAGMERSLDSSPSSRHIPAAVRRAVWQRDQGRCRYGDEHGRRCPERDLLEFHHGHPFGLGGVHSVANIRLMCRGHNAYLAEADYGRTAMARHRRPRRRASPTAAG